MSRRYDIVCNIGYHLAPHGVSIDIATELAKDVLWDAGQAEYDPDDEEQNKQEFDEIHSMLERYWNMRQENNENN